MTRHDMYTFSLLLLSIRKYTTASVQIPTGYSHLQTHVNACAFSLSFFRVASDRLDRFVACRSVEHPGGSGRRILRLIFSVK